MTGQVGTASARRAYSSTSGSLAARRGAKRRSARVSRNVFSLISIVVIAIFLLIGLSAYAASIQHANNVLTEQNAYLQAEIDSLNSQIVEQTKVTKIEDLATSKYGMVYPTDENCIIINEDADTVDTLAATIRSEAYN